MFSHEAILLEPHDVDELHVDALAGRGHAHQLTLGRPGGPHTATTFVTAGQNVSGCPRIFGNAARYMRKNSMIVWRLSLAAADEPSAVAARRFAVVSDIATKLIAESPTPNRLAAG